MSSRAGVWGTRFGWRLTRTTQRPCCLWTASEFTTTSSEFRCWRKCWKCPDCAGHCPSCYTWEDTEGRVHQIWQHEGRAIHIALEEVRGQMPEVELLFGFFDDIYIVSSLARTRTFYYLFQICLHRMAGTQSHGKTRVWNRVGVCPFDVAELGDEVWSFRGVKILGTPVGSPEFVHAFAMER